MKIFLTALLLIGFSFSTFSQEDIAAKIDELTYEWDEQAVKLSTYEGLSEFCTVAPYRESLVENLRQIHHYDSVLYDIVSQRARFGNNSELRKTLRDIEKLESEYSINDFLVFLHEECNARNDIERNAREYDEDKDAEVYRLETDLQKYVKDITKRIDVVREHVHHIQGE